MGKQFTATEIHTQKRPHEEGGWRAGRPVEDPEKTKRWGFVTARPSEFLVHVRRGKVRESSSGQGASCFKRPGDSVAVIPTSLQQLRFRADQVTLERVGVEVVGFAVYRIADPLVAYRVLNFSYPERAQEKLEETLTAMFVGAARRIIATLSLDDVLQKRKALVAEELLREVAPVVGGSGAIDDVAQRGWGIVLDSIEIQEVQVLSEVVFKSMQAPFRVALDRRAREAKAEADKEITTREAACARAIEEVRIQEALIVAERRRELADTEARIALDLAEKQLASEAAIRRRRDEIALIEEQQKTERALLLEALKKKEAESKLATHALLLEAAQKEAALELAKRASLEQQRRNEADVVRVEGEAAAFVLMERAKAQAVIDESQARVMLAKNLPALANAVGGKIAEVKIQSIGGEGNPFAQLTGAVSAVVDLVKSS